MAVLTKEELKAKISDKIQDGDLAIELLEDIEDSMNGNDNSQELEDLQGKYEELQNKYKERFLSGDEAEEPKEEKPEEDGLQEEEVVDVKEI